MRCYQVTRETQTETRLTTSFCPLCCLRPKARLRHTYRSSALQTRKGYVLRLLSPVPDVPWFHHFHTYQIRCLWALHMGPIWALYMGSQMGLAYVFPYGPYMGPIWALHMGPMWALHMGSIWKYRFHMSSMWICCGSVKITIPSLTFRTILEN